MPGDKMRWQGPERSRGRSQWIVCLSERETSGGCIEGDLEELILQVVSEDTCICYY